MGGDSDQDSENTDTADKTPEPTEDPGPDYDVPESEHMDLGQMARDWGSIFPNGNIANGWSPSQMYYDIADTTWIGGASDVIYDIFDFNAEDIPETFAQFMYTEDEPTEIKVDQLPGDTTREGLEQDLLDAGFEKQEEAGEFSIYTNPSRSEARALGNGYHLASFVNNPNFEVGIEDLRDRLDTVINHYISEEMQMDDHARDALDRIDADDWLAVTSYPESESDVYRLVSAFPQEKLPLAGAVTVDFQESDKRGVWKFGEESHAQVAYEYLIEDSLHESRGYESVERDGKYILATGDGDDYRFEDHTHIHPVKADI